MYFDRFDIVEAYWAYQYGWSSGNSQLTARDHDRASGMPAIATQIHRLHFRPGQSLSGGPETLTENGQAIYAALVEKHETVI